MTQISLTLATCQGLPCPHLTSERQRSNFQNWSKNDSFWLETEVSSGTFTQINSTSQESSLESRLSRQDVMTMPRESPSAVMDRIQVALPLNRVHSVQAP